MLRRENSHQEVLDRNFPIFSSLPEALQQQPTVSIICTPTHLHIDAAIELNIPLIVHSRNAEVETFDILKKKNSENLKILMHCFTGSFSLVKNLMNLNAYFSASGIITFNNSLELQNTFKKIPLEKILIETDSPFLAPVPMRGKKNEPSFLKFTLEKLSQIKLIDKILLDKVTTNNFNNLFFDCEK